MFSRDVIFSTAAKKEQGDSVYRNYYKFNSPVGKIAGHQVLAVNRGEREEFLKVSVETDRLLALDLLLRLVVKKPDCASTEFVKGAAEDSYDRLLAPSLEREVRAMLTEKAAEGAIGQFALNLRPLLMQPPVKGFVTMGLDPGYRMGCKVAVVDGTGKVLWSGGFEMTQPQVDTCGDYIVVADVTGKQFYVYNGEDEGQSIETALPIVRAKVAANGMVAVLLEDTDSNVLNIYNPYNTTTQLLVEIPTNVSEEGYPLDFDISPDGASVATSYLTITGNKMENRVGIYNFTEVGQDKNTLVGGMELGESMVACVEFVEEDEVAVFHQGGVALFGHMKQPELLGKLEFQQEIASVACNEKYIAVVTRGEDDSRELHMYDHKGKEKLSHPVSYEYSDMKLYRDEIFFTSSRSCHILRANGQEKFNCDFPDGLDTVFPTGSGRHYIVIEPEVIRKIKLVKK